MKWRHIGGSLAIFTLGVSLVAQEVTAATLHAYTNLIQIPVLVLTAEWGTHPAVPEDRFRISIDGGPPTRPRHVRRQGNDPIDLSILLDPAPSNGEMMPHVGEDLRRLTPEFLTAHDSVSVYATGCGLFQARLTGPVNGAELERVVSAALQRAGAPRGSCTEGVSILDALAYMTNDLAATRGRRVILAITSGDDHGSRQKWGEVKQFAQEKGVAIFGIRYAPVAENSLPRIAVVREDLFSTVCQLTGGIVITSNTHTLPNNLQRFAVMLRERYIVEFSRSDQATGGAHSLLISVGEPDAIVRPTGLGVPLPDRNVLADPTTVRSNDSSAPEPGVRKILPARK